MNEVIHSLKLINDFNLQNLCLYSIYKYRIMQLYSCPIDMDGGEFFSCALGRGRGRGRGQNWVLVKEVKSTLGLLPSSTPSWWGCERSWHNNRFLSVKCKQCTGVLLVGYEPTSNVLLLVDVRLRQRKNTCILKKKKRIKQNISRELGWRSGENSRLLPRWPGFVPQTWRHMWTVHTLGAFSGFHPFTKLTC